MILENLYRDFVNKIIIALQEEFSYPFLWYFLFFASGIVLYFRIDSFLSFKSSALLLIALSLIVYSFHKAQYLKLLLFCACFLFLGMIAAYIREYIIDAPVLTENLTNVIVKGDVIRIEDLQGMRRLHIMPNSITDSRGKSLKEKCKIHKLRINFKMKNPRILVGDMIQVRANLMPVPKQVIPGGFDFRRFMRFKKIGAIGYAIGKPKVLEFGSKRVWGGILHTIEVLRDKISHNIKRAIKNQDSASIAVALLVGKSSEINKDHIEAMRISGTAHLVAISGLHMALFCGVVFLVLRRLLLYIICTFHFSSAYVKKYAAVLSIIIGFIYLLLTGLPVSAERAFIMSLLFYLAIILDLKVDPLHSLLLAVFIILILQPEAIMSPSLQMSASACIALIKAFRWTSAAFFIRVFQNPDSEYKDKRMIFYIISLMLASFAAGLGTMPFIGYHFHQLSTYSLFSNLLCVPLSEFIVMPLGLLSMILMPFGFEKAALVPMGFGIEILIFIASFFASLPKASIFIAPFEDYIFGFIVMGYVFIMLFQTKQIKMLGVCLFCFGIYKAYVTEKAIMFISNDIFGVRVGDDLYTSSSKRGNKFTKSIWAKYIDAKEIKTLNKDNKECNLQYCIISCSSNSNALVILNKDASKEICNIKESYDTVINLSAAHYKCANAKFHINKHQIKESLKMTCKMNMVDIIL